MALVERAEHTPARPANELEDPSDRSAETHPGDPTRLTNGPFDLTELTDPAREGRLDCGSLLVALPPGLEARVERRQNERSVGVHIPTPTGHLRLHVLAAPRSGSLWTEVSEEIFATQLGARIRVHREHGEWGPEVVTSSEGTVYRFIGINGPRWMLYGVATSPIAEGRALAAALRAVLRATVVVRGDEPYPAKGPLPLFAPGQSAPDHELASGTDSTPPWQGAVLSLVAPDGWSTGQQPAVPPQRSGEHPSDRSVPAPQPPSVPPPTDQPARLSATERLAVETGRPGTVDTGPAGLLPPHPTRSIGRQRLSGPTRPARAVPSAATPAADPRPPATRAGRRPPAPPAPPVRSVGQIRLTGPIIDPPTVPPSVPPSVPPPVTPAPLFESEPPAEPAGRDPSVEDTSPNLLRVPPWAPPTTPATMTGPSGSSGERRPAEPTNSPLPVEVGWSAVSGPPTPDIPMAPSEQPGAVETVPDAEPPPRRIGFLTDPPTLPLRLPSLQAPPEVVESPGPAEPVRPRSEPFDPQRGQGREVERTDPIYLPLTSDEAVSHLWSSTREESREHRREQIREH
jgi:hypothetical protein